MTILEIFKNFTTAIADIDLYRSSVETAADRELQHLLLHKQSAAKAGIRETMSLRNMFFRDATAGHPIFYGFRDVTVDDGIRNLVRHTNRQHQWFLAEAYELFEEFVKRSYAFMGMSTPTRWPLRDFGGALWDEVQSKDYQWYLEQARTKKDAPLAMMRQFRKVLPRMAKVESDNLMKCDLQVAVMLIAHMRHCIVHSRGFIRDKSAFADDLLKKLGYSGTGAAPHTKFIEETLLVNPANGAIHLLKVPAPDSEPPFQFHYDIFEEMVGYLLVYAHQIYLSLGGQSIDKFDDVPQRAPESPSAVSDV